MINIRLVSFNPTSQNCAFKNNYTRCCFEGMNRFEDLVVDGITNSWRKEKFEDTKRLMRNRKYKDRQYKGQEFEDT